MTSSEIVAVMAALGLLSAYHFLLWRRIRTYPESTVVGYARLSRVRWVKSVVAERRDLLAVQTLRNWSMAASFLASTAVLLTIGLLGSVLNVRGLPVLMHRLNLFGSTDESVILLKVMIVITLLLFAFGNFTMAIRYYNHVSIAIGVPDPGNSNGNIRVVVRLLERGARHYMLGMRGYYLAFPVVMWLFGPAWMLAGTLVLCAWLWRVDTLPEPAGHARACRPSDRPHLEDDGPNTGDEP